MLETTDEGYSSIEDCNESTSSCSLWSETINWREIIESAKFGRTNLSDEEKKELENMITTFFNQLRSHQITLSSNPHDWTSLDVIHWLYSIEMIKYIPSFLHQCIDGPCLFELNSSEFNILGITPEDQKILQYYIKILSLDLRRQIHKWNQTQLIEWMAANGGESFISLFQNQGFDGEEFLAMNEVYLNSLRLKASDRRKILYLRKMALGKTKKYIQNFSCENLSRIKSADDIMKKEVLNFDTYSHRRTPVVAYNENFTSPSSLSFSLDVPKKGSVIHVKLMTDECFIVKSLTQDDDFESFQNWLTKEFGPFHRAKSLLGGVVYSIQDDEDFWCLKECSRRKPVKVFVHEIPSEFKK
jgi:hypothetical protein